MIYTAGRKHISYFSCTVLLVIGCLPSRNLSPDFPLPEIPSEVHPSLIEQQLQWQVTQQGNTQTLIYLSNQQEKYLSFAEVMQLFLAGTQNQAFFKQFRTLILDTVISHGWQTTGFRLLGKEDTAGKFVLKLSKGTYAPGPIHIGQPYTPNNFINQDYLAVPQRCKRAAFRYNDHAIVVISIHGTLLVCPRLHITTFFDLLEQSLTDDLYHHAYVSLMQTFAQLYLDMRTYERAHHTSIAKASLAINCGSQGLQVVPHLHIHLSTSQAFRPILKQHLRQLNLPSLQNYRW